MNAPTTPAHTPALASRLPNVGTTIFTVMSALAAERVSLSRSNGALRPVFFKTISSRS